MSCHQDAASEIAAELQGFPDFIIGNYSDGNLVASLLAYKMGVTQVSSLFCPSFFERFVKLYSKFYLTNFGFDMCSAPLHMHWRKQNIQIQIYTGKNSRINTTSHVNSLLI